MKQIKFFRKVRVDFNLDDPTVRNSEVELQEYFLKKLYFCLKHKHC